MTGDQPSIFSGLMRRVLHRVPSEPRDVFERRTAFYAQFLGVGDLAFDIGANVGHHAAAMREAGALVITVEPQADCARILRRRFAPRAGVASRVEIVASAVGEKEGDVVLHTTQSSLIATASPEFIRATHESGRFGDYTYTGSRTVKMLTLDTLVAVYGAPTFIKLDVEGYEYPALCGLSRRPRALRTLSFEFTPEFMDSTHRCLERLGTLGATEAAYVVNDAMAFACHGWMPLELITQDLRQFLGDTKAFGDVFVRWTS